MSEKAANDGINPLSMCMHPYIHTNTHTQIHRILQAINMSEKAANDGINPLLARFFQIFAIASIENASSHNGDANAEMSFRAFMLCVCMFRGSMGEAEKLKFWYNVMNGTRNSNSNIGQNDDSEISVSESGVQGDHLSGLATGQMVALFLCDAVCGSIGAVSAANKARSVSTTYTHTLCVNFLYTHIHNMCGFVFWPWCFHGHVHTQLCG